MSKNLANVKDEQLHFNFFTPENIMQFNIEVMQVMFQSVLETIKQGKDPFQTETTITKTEDTAEGTKVTVTVIEFGKERIVSATEN